MNNKARERENKWREHDRFITATIDCVSIKVALALAVKVVARKYNEKHFSHVDKEREIFKRRCEYREFDPSGKAIPAVRA
jgi:hypothetical protein